MNICNYVSSWLGIAGDESCITKNDKRIKIANVAKKQQIITSARAGARPATPTEIFRPARVLSLPWDSTSVQFVGSTSTMWD